MLQAGRSRNAGGYRFGFQGQEADNKIGGLGQHTTAQFWEYDTWAVKRWNTDPIDIPNLSPYSVFGNNPIANNDVNGDSPLSYIAKRLAREGLKKATSDFVKYEVKQRLSTYASKSWAKQLIKDADAVLEVADKSWLEFALETAVDLSPVGDIVGGYQFSKEMYEKFDALQDIQKKANRLIAKTKWLDNARIKGKVYKIAGKFDPEKYRENLQIATGKLADGYDAHHTLPKSQEFDAFFKRSGIDVNDPKYLIWRERKGHIGTPSDHHNKEWKKFMNKNLDKTVSPSDLLKERDRIEKAVWGNTTGDTPSY